MYVLLVSQSDKRLQDTQHTPQAIKYHEAHVTCVIAVISCLH